MSQHLLRPSQPHSAVESLTYPLTTTSAHIGQTILFLHESASVESKCRSLESSAAAFGKFFFGGSNNSATASPKR
ncbi:hypothetical protein PIB30_046885 [Stylosanthes scabra]|uniref:Uncharacterized protein n=1 Tax=Stylosanthes scabra TaxID=79078 RepID=A0ABU6TGB1_9FABA|nr:hypothetical protein [Stylosanthes scabra]